MTDIEAVLAEVEATPTAPADDNPDIVQVWIAKAEQSFGVDLMKIHARCYHYSIITGLKPILGRGLTGPKAPKDLDGIRKKVESTLAQLYDGTLRMIGVKAEKKGGDRELQAEIRRLAKAKVKILLKAAGYKLKDFSASDLTYFATGPGQYAEKHAEELEKEAKFNLAALAKATVSPSEINFASRAKAGPKDKAPLSAKQAGITAKHKPAQQASARH